MNHKKGTTMEPMGSDETGVQGLGMNVIRIVSAIC